MNLSSTIDLVELLVVVLGIVGFTISLIMLAVIQGDRRNVKKAGLNGIHKRMTNADLRNELSRAYKLIGFTTIGIMSMFVPPPLRDGNRFVGTVFTWMLISWEAIAVINSLWAYVDWRRNVETLRTLEEMTAERDALRDVDRDAPRDSERDHDRDITRDVDRDALRDTKRDVDRDIEHDKALEEGAS